MKNRYFIFVVLFALLGISCSRLVDYTEIPFVYFPSPSISVYEDTGVVEIPVKAIADVAFTLTFETKDGEKKDASTGLMIPNGQRGVDYDIVDNDAAIVHFAAGETEKIIKVSIADFTGTLTGNKDFTIKMTGSGNEVARGGYSYCKVTIIDNDHPLKSIFGEYEATDGDGVSWTLTLAADPDNWYTTFVDGIVPGFAGDWVGKGIRHYVPATVPEDLSSFNVPLGYKLADPFNEQDITIYGLSGNSVSSSGSLTFAKTENGFKLDGTKGILAGFQDGDYISYYGPSFMAMPPITLVKK